MNSSNRIFLRNKYYLFILVILSIFWQTLFCLGSTNDSESLFRTKIIVCRDTDYQTNAYFYSS